MSKITANSSSRTGKDHAHQSAAAAAAVSSSSLDNDLKKGPWTAEEDHKLVDYIKKHGHGRWRTLPKNAGLRRCGKSCRLRWTNYLRPDIKRGRFSYEEEETIIQLHSILGNKWSAIAARLPGRTDNEIKNYWNTHIKKRLLRMGIDPITHAPRLDPVHLSSILFSSLHNNYPYLSNSHGVTGSTASDQNKDLLDLANQLMMISQSIPEGTPVSSLESVLANYQLQTLNHIQIQGQDGSPNLGYVGRPYHTLPISSWETNHGGFAQTLNSLGAEGSAHLGHSTDEYLGSVHFEPSMTDPNNELRCNNVKEVVQNSGASPALSSPMSNSGCTFNSSSSTIMRYVTSGAFNFEDERETAYRSSGGFMYDNIMNVSSVNSFM